MNERVLRVIRAGGPMTIDDVARTLGMTRRDVESAVQELRLRGEPIIDVGRNGLALTSDPDELAAYLEKRRRRTATVHRGTMSMRRTLRQMTTPTPSLWPDL